MEQNESWKSHTEKGMSVQDEKVSLFLVVSLAVRGAVSESHTQAGVDLQL